MAKGGANHHHNNSSHMHDQGRSGEHRPRSSPSDELSRTATPIISQLTPSGLSVQERRGCFRSAADAAAASGGCASVGRARLTAALFAVAGLAAISCYVTGVVVGGGGSGGGSGGGAFLVQSQPRALSDAVRGLERGGRKGTSKRTGIKWGAGSEVTLRGRIDPGQEERRAQYQPVRLPTRVPRHPVWSTASVTAVLSRTRALDVRKELWCGENQQQTSRLLSLAKFTWHRPEAAREGKGSVKFGACSPASDLFSRPRFFPPAFSTG